MIGSGSKDYQSNRHHQANKWGLKGAQRNSHHRICQPRQNGANCRDCYSNSKAAKSAYALYIKSDNQWGRGKKNRTNRWRRAPEGVRTSTRPATDRSRSNQVCHRPPPYGSTFTLSHALFLTSLLTGFSFRHGLQPEKGSD